VILAIESSCDDSSVAVMDERSFELKFYEKISQEADHAKYGGVVPELAARLHTEALPRILQRAKPYFGELSAVAATNTPGLSVSLIGGVNMAKALALALNLPLIGVNHLIGHVYSLFLGGEARFPMGVLLVSGGHTMVLDIDAAGGIEILATTGDDSFGESFDKVAKMLGLGYPGGVAVEKAAKSGRERFKFTVPLLGDARTAYSFSGLKNQVRVETQKLAESGNLGAQDVADICFAFENTACKHILNKLEKIFAQRKFERFGVVGGASANLNLRSRLQALCEKYGCELICAPLEFCSDNAAMIARAGREKYLRGEFAGLDLQASPRSELTRI